MFATAYAVPARNLPTVMSITPVARAMRAVERAKVVAVSKRAGRLPALSQSGPAGKAPKIVPTSSAEVMSDLTW